MIATSPAHKDAGVNPAILYAMKLCGADTVLALGGVQAAQGLGGSGAVHAGSVETAGAVTRVAAMPAFKAAYLVHGDDHGRISSRSPSRAAAASRCSRATPRRRRTAAWR